MNHCLSLRWTKPNVSTHKNESSIKKIITKVLLKNLTLFNVPEEVRRVRFNDKTNTGSINEQTKTRPEETIDFKIKKSKQIFSFNIPIELEEERSMLGNIVSETFNSNFSITEKNMEFINFSSGYYDDLFTINSMEYQIATKKGKSEQ